MFRKFICLAITLLVLASCVPQSSASYVISPPVTPAATRLPPDVTSLAQDSAGTVTPISVPPTPTLAAPTVVPTGTATPAPTVTLSPTFVPQAMGPDTFPAGMNPLTGLTAPDPKELAVAPVLVSITDSPLTTRPQAGLTFASFVYEYYLGEGATRFLAVFYANPPTQMVNGKLESDSVKVGPIRSGRLPYESLRKLYNGFLVFAGASDYVLSRLHNYLVVYGSQTIDINQAFVSVKEMRQLAGSGARKFDPTTMTGLRFDPQPPSGGRPANQLWIPYNLRAQILWRYDPASGYYNRYQDQDDGATFVKATDRLNGKTVESSNVIVMFADTHFYDLTTFSIDLMNITKMEAVLLRDGKMYPIYWKTVVDDYSRKTGLLRPPRFVDAQGNPVALKPGQTWVEIVPRFTPYYESVISDNYLYKINNKQPGSGNWTVQFVAPAPEYPGDLSGVPLP
jgi:hypothetical protein